MKRRWKIKCLTYINIFLHNIYNIHKNTKCYIDFKFCMKRSSSQIQYFSLASLAFYFERMRKGWLEWVQLVCHWMFGTQRIGYQHTNMLHCCTIKPPTPWIRKWWGEKRIIFKHMILVSTLCQNECMSHLGKKEHNLQSYLEWGYVGGQEDDWTHHCIGIELVWWLKQPHLKHIARQIGSCLEISRWK